MYLKLFKDFLLFTAIYTLPDLNVTLCAAITTRKDHACAINGMLLNTDDCEFTKVFCSNLKNETMIISSLALVEAYHWFRDSLEVLDDSQLINTSFHNRYVLFSNVIDAKEMSYSNLDGVMSYYFNLPVFHAPLACRISKGLPLNSKLFLNISKAINQPDCHMWRKIDLIYASVSLKHLLVHEMPVNEVIEYDDLYYTTYTELLDNAERFDIQNFLTDSDWYRFSLISSSTEFEHKIEELQMHLKQDIVMNRLSLNSKAYITSRQAYQIKLFHKGLLLPEKFYKIWVPVYVANYKRNLLYRTCKTSSLSFSYEEQSFRDCNECRRHLQEKMIESNYTYSMVCTGHPASFFYFCGMCKNNFAEESCGDVISLKHDNTVLNVCVEDNQEVMCQSGYAKQKLYFGNLVVTIDSIEHPKMSKKPYFIKDRVLLAGKIAELNTIGTEFGSPQLINNTLNEYTRRAVTSISYKHREKVVVLNKCWPDTYDKVADLKPVDGDYKILDDKVEVQVSGQIIMNIQAEFDTEEFKHLLDDFTIVISGMSCFGCYDCNFGLICRFEVKSEGSGITSFSCSNTYKQYAPVHLQIGLNAFSRHLFIYKRENAYCQLGKVKFNIITDQERRDQKFLSSKKVNKGSFEDLQKNTELLHDKLRTFIASNYLVAVFVVIGMTSVTVFIYLITHTVKLKSN